MKYKSEVIFFQLEPFGEVKMRYLVRQKKHWWSRWKYIKEHGVPRLFTSEEILKFKKQNNNEKKKIQNVQNIQNI